MARDSLGGRWLEGRVPRQRPLAVTLGRRGTIPACLFFDARAERF
jgi:hypothetical protein